LFFGCNENQQKETIGSVKSVKILQAWQGDYPVNQLDLLPDKQQEQAVGFITDSSSFLEIWQQFKPNKDIPEINFKDNLILFARNLVYYNRISIGQVKLKDGLAEVLAMETKSALPIENNVAFSMAVISRQEINSIQIGNDKIPIH
jgi:hypothetical protein